MVKWMSKSIKVLFVLLFISSIVIPVGKGEDQYNHIWTAEPPVPESGSWFGYQLAIDGEYIITNEPYAEVGDLTGAGKIYVYDFEGNLIKTHQSPEPATQNQFGEWFDVHDGVLVTFDPLDVDGVKDAGKLHVYDILDDLSYTITQTIPVKNNYFGATSAIGEDIILIQDAAKDLTPIYACEVHLYDHNGEYIKTIYSPDPQPIGWFGLSVEIGENQFYLTQSGYLGAQRGVGPGYVYVYDHQGVLLNTIEAPEPEEQAVFGFTMSVSGDKIVISEIQATVDGIDDAGKVHIYNTDGEYLRTLLSPNPDTNAWFGRDVAISGDIIVVGEQFGDIAPSLNEGKAYVFNIDGTLLQTLTAPEPSPRGAFGLDVDIQDDIIVVSEPWAEVEGQPDCGRIHVYKLGAPVKAQGSGEEETTQVSDEPDSEPSGGIPGYPLWSIGLALLLVSIFISRTQNDKTLLLSQ